MELTSAKLAPCRDRAAATNTLVSNTTLISCWCLKRLRNCSALNPRRAALGKRAHLLQGRHRGVAWEGGQQRAMRPAQLHRFRRVFTSQQTVDEPGRVAVPATDAIQHV